MFSINFDGISLVRSDTISGALLSSSRVILDTTAILFPSINWFINDCDQTENSSSKNPPKTDVST